MAVASFYIHEIINRQLDIPEVGQYGVASGFFTWTFIACPIKSVV